MEIPPWLALAAGIAFALALGNPRPALTRKLAQKTLAAAVICLGAGMDLAVVARVGLHGLGYTAIGIAVALGGGTWLGRRLGVARDAALLVSVGTAICGGSAIAAVAPTIDASDDDTSIALVLVFVLNAVALVAFPAIGGALGMDQDQFGLWSALAIHDTSSVVGASAHYGERALAVATAAKLARALWIVPVTFAIALSRARRARLDADAAGHRAVVVAPRARPKRPWFIAGFLAVAALVTWVPALRPAGALVAQLAHAVLAISLFLIGLGLTRPALRRVGARPLVLALALWVTLASATLAAILAGVIHV